jgi:midasin
MIDLRDSPDKTFMSQFHDPLSINLCKQVRALVSKLPTGSQISAALTDAIHAPSYDLLLGTLSDALALPALTVTIASTFRPILFDLCARWLLTDENMEDQFVALCLLIEIHTELFPYAFLLSPGSRRLTLFLLVFSLLF